MSTTSTPPPTWEAVARLPADAVIIHTPDAHWSAATLLDAASGFAERLRACGVEAGSAVVLALPNVPEFVIAYLALRRCGAVLVNVPWQWRRELRDVVLALDAPVVVAPAAARSDPILAPIASRLVDAAGPRRGASPRAVARSPDDLAWLAYSSGTSGAPKGAVHTERTLQRMPEAFIERYDLGAADRVLVASPVGHAVGFVYGVELALRLGCPMVLLPRWDAGQAAALVARHGCTFLAAPTPFLLDLTEHAERHGARELRSLRTFLCGGAPVPRALRVRAHAAMPGTRASAYYGTSECGGVASFGPEADEEEILAGEGVPLPGIDVRVVDGELHVRGVQLARGYVGGDAEGRFRDDGWFATRDRAIISESGVVRITGRVGEWIRRGGVTVSPDELEAVLAGCDGVREVAVGGAPDERLGERVVAYVVPDGAGPSVEALRRTCCDAGLAKVKWPERVVYVAELPRTPSGKLLRRALVRQEERA